MFHTDAEKLRFLLQTDAELSAFLADVAAEADAGEQGSRPVTNYIGSKEKPTVQSGRTGAAISLTTALCW